MSKHSPRASDSVVLQALGMPIRWIRTSSASHGPVGPVGRARYAQTMSVAAFPSMLKQDRERNGLRFARAAWVCGVTIREYRELEAGEAMPSPDAYERIVQYFGWPDSRSLNW